MLHQELFQTLIGPSVPAASSSTLSAMTARYESDFVKYEAQHWASDGSSWSASNYYDRAFVNYVWYARTGDATYLNHANAIAQDYLKNYVEANDYSVGSWWSMPKGLTAHYLVNGDAGSLTAIGKMADQIAAPYYLENNWANLFDPRQSEGREQARALETLTQAIIVNAPSVGVPKIQANGDDWGVSGGNDFRALAKSLVEKTLTSDYQSADGSRPSYAGEDIVNRPFMNGLMNESLINYYEQVEADPRIVAFIKKNLDYMWSNDWVADAKAFKYVDKSTSTGEVDIPAPDLNMLIVNGFGFVYKHTGDETYKQRGDIVFEGAVEGAWLAGSKQFNQQYTSSYNYLAYTNPELASWDTSAPPADLGDAPKSGPQPDAGLLLNGTSGADVLQGGGANDKLNGLAGADKLYGGGGDDVLTGDAGQDVLDGGEGADTASYLTAIDAVVADLGATRNNRGDAYRDTYVSIENLAGSNFADMLRGDVGANVLWGHAGNDMLHGKAGADTLHGGDGDDRLSGDADADILFGGSGSDVFTFKALSDSRPAAFDTIMDFTPSVDRIDLRAIDSNVKLRGDQAFVYLASAEFTGRAGELRLGDGFIAGDVNGDKTADFLIKFNGTTSITAIDIYL